MARRLAVGLALVFALLATSAHAANTLTVSNNHDSGPGSLRQALIDAAPGDTVVIPASVGQITLTSGVLSINKSVTVQGAGSTHTVISGGNDLQVFAIDGPATVAMSGLTVEDGDEMEALSATGGGILDHDADLTISDSVITANTASTPGFGSANGGTALGGGIAADTESSSLTLIDTTVSDNQALSQALGTGVGGAASGGGVFARGPLVIRGGSIEGNTSNTSSSTGSAGLASGGGVEFHPQTSTGTATIENVRVRGNEALANGGPGKNGSEADTGGLVLVGGSGATLANDTVNLNSAIANGGTNAAGGNADNGGILAADAPATIVNTTVTGNEAIADGQGTGTGGSAMAGGLGADDQTSVMNSTIDANTVTATGPGGPGTPEGGNVLGAVHFQNSIVAGGTAAAGSENCAGNSQVSEGHNIDSLDQCNFHAAGDRVNTDPLLGPLADNGGPVETMALQPGSPAIDAGDSSACPPTDARGALRPGGAACDIGAFEVATARALTDAASAVGTTTATLNGTAGNPDLAGGSVAFQFGTTPAYGKSTGAQPIGALTGLTPFSSGLTGLAPGTTYHFREVVTNALGTNVGADQTFTTLSPKLVLSGAPRLTADGLGVRFTVLCSAGTCKGRATETTLEHIRGGKIQSLSAKRRTRTKKHTVTVGRLNFSLAAGAKKSFIVKLNKTGRKLEKRFKKMPVKLTVSLIGPDGKATVVKTSRVTLKPHKKRHKTSAR